LSYTIKCTASYDSIPYSLADSVRLESSSKGSSCPAVEWLLLFILHVAVYECDMGRTHK